MKALHTYIKIARQLRRKTVRRIDILDVEKKSKSKKAAVKNVVNMMQSKSSKSKEKRKHAPCNLEIDPVSVAVRVSHPRIRIRSNNALNDTTLRPPTIPSTCSAHLWNTLRPVHLHAFRHAR